jgi:uncharacterized protein (DUF1499 family)
VAIASVLAALASGPGYQAGVWDYGTGFLIFRWSSYVAAGAGVAALAGALVGARGWQKHPIIIGAIGLAVALALVVPAWQLENTAKNVPRIHDITTDTTNPPQFVALLPVRQKTPNGPEYAGEKIAQQQKAAYPDIQPIVLKEPPGRSFERALAAARAMGWEIVAAVAAEGRIEATATTRWFRFKDDIVVRVTPSSGGSRVDVRSKSRIGRSDLGANAKRIRLYTQKLVG